MLHSGQNMKIGKNLIISILFILITLPGFAQYVDYGQDPSHIRWKQINTKNFQIIFPDFFEENAQKIANIYETLYHHSNSLGRTPQKISMIVHTEGGISNGSVTWAPKRTDLYTVPPQDPTDSWLEHLCVHEFRHVVQIDKVNQGFSKILYYIFGEQLTIAVVGVYVPKWFLEGDAVCFETAVGQIGRGRSPEFLNEIKAQVVDKKIYSYYKAVLGSYKDFVPDQYAMGYYMVGLSRINYGNKIWSDALSRVGRRPLGISPFAKSLKLTMAGRRDSLWSDSTFQSLFINADSVKKANTYCDAKRTLYHDNFSELQQKWKQETHQVENTFDTIPTSNKYYTGYYYPTPLANGQLLAYKDGLQETGAFVLLKDGKEKFLTRTGYLYDRKFVSDGKKIVWTEYRPGLRWEQGGKVVLTSYDIPSGKYKRYKGYQNRFAPFLAGDKWGFVEANNNNEASIVLVDSSLKNECFRITAGKEELFIHPSFNNSKIITVVQTTDGIHLESIDPQTKERTRLSRNMFYELDNPLSFNEGLLYRASFNSNDAFYLKDAANNTRQIITSKYGVRFPVLNTKGDSLYFSFYTADGYKPGKLGVCDFLDKPVKETFFPIADSLKTLENWNLSLEADSVYSVRKYGKAAHLVNIHSWGPLFINLKDEKINFGVAINSQNMLSTLAFSAGYVHDQDYNRGAFIFNTTYSGWWPKLELNLKTGGYDYYSYGLFKNGNEVDTLLLFNKSLHTTADITTRLPFNISTRNYSRSIQSYIRYKIDALHRIKPKEIFGATPDATYQFNIPSRYYQLLEYGLSFSNQTYMTDQEINPRWGQIINFGYSHTPLKNIQLGDIWWAEGRFYFPGFLTNHTLAIYLGQQQMSDKNCYYSNKILYPRGIKLYGYNLSTVRSSYKMPLCFPDAHISSLLYIKGIDGGVFYDAAREENNWNNSWYHSYGVELTADTHFFRLPFPINMGFRTGYETQHRKVFVDFLFSVGLSI